MFEFGFLQKKKQLQIKMEIKMKIQKAENTERTEKIESVKRWKRQKIQANPYNGL